MTKELASRVDTRQSNMELLRIIAILGVILLHYNGGAGNGFALVTSYENTVLLYTLEFAYAWAVNAVLMLSGYFMYERKRVSMKKPIMLLVQLLVFQVGRVCFEAYKAHSAVTKSAILACLVPENYYVVLYIVVFMFSPYINLLFNKLNAKQQRALLIMAFAVFSVWSYGIDLLTSSTGHNFAQATAIGMSGTQGGYTIVNFMLCYLIGAGLRTDALKVKMPIIVPILAYIASTFLVLRIGLRFGVYTGIEYCNPFVIIQAASLICVFERINIGRSRVINKLAEASYSVFLAHWCFYSFCMIERYIYARVWVLLGHVVLCQIGMYLVCFVIFLVYDAITKPLFKLLWSKVKAPEINLESANA